MSEDEIDYLRRVGGLNIDAKPEPRTTGWPTQYELLEIARRYYKEGKSAEEAAGEIRGYLGNYG